MRKQFGAINSNGVEPNRTVGILMMTSSGINTHNLTSIGSGTSNGTGTSTSIRTNLSDIVNATASTSAGKSTITNTGT
jgi:hypothetical protein